MDNSSKKTAVHQRSLTEEQLKEFREAFDLLDTNHDGCISTKELGLLLRSLGENPTQQQLMDITNEIDVDDNQTIDLMGFVKMMARKQQESDGMDNAIRDAFRVFDPDGRGCISTEEVRLALGHATDHRQQLTDADIEEMLIMIDPDQDDRIDYHAFAELLGANGRSIFL